MRYTRGWCEMHPAAQMNCAAYFMSISLIPVRWRLSQSWSDGLIRSSRGSGACAELSRDGFVKRFKRRRKLGVQKLRTSGVAEAQELRSEVRKVQDALRAGKRYGQPFKPFRLDTLESNRPVF